MKERPILFTPENAQKIADGQKVQTRRILKPQPEHGMMIKGPEFYAPCAIDKDGEMYPGDDVFGAYSEDGRWGVVCPYGTVGDRLFITQPSPGSTGTPEERLLWKPDQAAKVKGHRWLEITEVRVERVQDITYEDEGREGIRLDERCNDRHSGFIALWESIYGPGAWERNDWVWVVSFKRIMP